MKELKVYPCMRGQRILFQFRWKGVLHSYRVNRPEELEQMFSKLKAIYLRRGKHKEWAEENIRIRTMLHASRRNRVDN